MKALHEYFLMVVLTLLLMFLQILCLICTEKLVSERVICTCATNASTDGRGLRSVPKKRPVVQLVFSN